MVDVDDSGMVKRRRVPRSEFDSADVGAGSIDRLTDARLLSTDRGTVEIAHEALIRAWPRLRDWVEEDRNGLRTHRRLTEAAAAWESLSRDEGALYRGTRLAAAAEWAEHRREALTPTELRFLDTSIAVEVSQRRSARRRARYLRTLAGCLAVLLVLVAVVAVVAIRRGRDSSAQRQIAISRQFAAQAQASTAIDGGRAIVSALDAWQASETVEARSVVLSLASRPSYDGRMSFTPGGPGVAALSPDGRRVAVYADSGTGFDMWDLVTQARIATLNEPVPADPHLQGDESYAGVALDATGRRLAVVMESGRIIRWNLTGHVPQVTTWSNGSPAAGLALSRDGRMLATADADGAIKVWDTATDRLMHRLRGRPVQEPVTIAFSPDDRTLARAESAGITMWDLATGHQSAIGTRGEPVNVRFSPDGRLIAASRATGNIDLWDARTHAFIRDLEGHLGVVTGLAFGRTGTTLVSAGGDNAVIVWDLKNGMPLRRLTAGEAGGLHEVSVAADGTIDATSADAAVIWKAGRLPVVGDPTAVAFSPDGQHIDSVDGSTRFRSWNLSGQQLSSDVVAAGPDLYPAFSLDGRLLAVRNADQPVFTIWDVVRRRVLSTLKDPVVGAAYRDRTAFNADGHLFAVGGGGTTGIVDVWQTDNRRLVQHIDIGGAGPSFALRPDGRELAIADGDGDGITLWSLSSGLPAAHLAGTAGSAGSAGIVNLTYDPSGHRLAAVSETGDISVWDVARGRRTAALAGNGRVSVVTFSHDGRFLATAGDDTAVTVWQMPAGTRWATLTGHTEPVITAAWNPDGNTLLTGSRDGTITAWKVNTAQAVTSLCDALTEDYSPSPAGGHSCRNAKQ